MKLRMILAVFVTLASAVFLAYGYFFGAAAVGWSRPFHEPTSFDRYVAFLLAFAGLAMQGLSARLLSPLWSSFLRGLLASLAVTLLLLPIVFWFLLVASGV